jgi:hypothetical protein
MAALRWLGSFALGCIITLVAPVAAASIIEDSVTLSTTGQSMWKSGATSVLSEETFLGVKWGTYEGAGADPERLALGGIIGEENYLVPGTGGTIPNPARLLWDGAMATCRATGTSYNTCKNGTSAVRACAPSWLGGGCTTVFPAIPGLGNPPAATIDNPIPGQYIDTRTGLQGGIETSGEAGIIPWVEATAGGVDVALPFSATIDIPDAIGAGQTFTIATSYAVQNMASITANAPSFKAGVDGIFNSDNDLFGTACVILAGCAEGETPADVKPGRFGIVSIDTSEDNFLRVFGGERGDGSLGVPGIAFDDVQIFYAPTPENPDGVDDDITPKKIPSPRLGDFTVSNPQDFTGGVVTDNQLGLTTNQTLLSLNASITGIGELALASPGILSNKIEIAGPIAIEYTLLDVAAGPRLGVQQDFSLDPNAFVRLEFDKPVVQRTPPTIVRVPRLVYEEYCVYEFLGTCFGTAQRPRIVYDDVVIPGSETVSNVVEIALGDSLELSFLGGVGNIVNREYFLKDPTFSNRTGATIDPGLKVEIGCIGIDIITADRLCALEEDFKTAGLINLNLFDDSWTLGGFGTAAFADTIMLAAADVPGGGPTDGNRVPAPPVIFLLAGGLLLLGAARRRQAAMMRG